MYLDDGVVYRAWFCFLLQHADPFECDRIYQVAVM